MAETHVDLEETVKELHPQVLTRDELETLKEACRSEFNYSPYAARMQGVVNSFVELCELLGKPDTRAISLTMSSAYVKVLGEKGGEPIVWKGKGREGKEGQIPTVGIMEGLCLLVCDASFSMSERAFPDNDLVKLRMVTRAVHRAIFELYDISKPGPEEEAVFADGERNPEGVWERRIKSVSF